MIWNRVCRNSHGVAACVLAGLIALPTLAAAQERVIGGRVVDAQTGRPIPTVQVFIPGTAVGTLTNAAGRFRLVLSAAEPDVVSLRVVRIGYTESVVEQVRVGTQDLVVQLRETALRLDEVLVTAVAGETQRRAIGHSVDRISAPDIVEGVGVPDVGRLLDGRSAGVVVLHSAGQAGSGPRINIRGTTSISLDKQPLIYIDGVRVTNVHASGPQVQGFGSSLISRLNDISPEDIESIEVIKGPAAATLYGTEAANGLIHITTKRGSAGSPTVDVLMRQGAQWLDGILDHHNMTNYERDANGDLYTLNYARELSKQGEHPFRTGAIQGYGVSVRGGTEDVRYYGALNVDREEGVHHDNLSRRYSGRVNLEFSPHETLDVTTNVGYGTGKINLTRETAIWSVLTTSSPIEFAEGRLEQRPPHILRLSADDFQAYDRLTWGLTLRHRPTPWFNQRLVVGRDRTTEDDQRIQERMGGELLDWYTGAVTLGSKSRRNTDRLVTTLDYNSSITFEATEALRSTTSFGAQYFNTRTDWLEASGREFPARGVDVLTAAGLTFGLDERVENTTIGFFAQQQFSWRDRVYVTAALRVDDNSAFGQDFSWVTYPKASATWVVSDEPFWNARWVDALRLRAAYGQSGQQPDYFAAVRSYRPIPTGDGGAAISPHFFGNPELKPERGSEIELGLDASLLNDRISVDATFYNSRTFDAILGRPMAPSTGFSGVRYVNVGETARHGLELLLKTRPVALRNLTWDIDVKFSWNESEIKSLGEGVDEIPLAGGSVTGVSAMRVGGPVGAWYWYRPVSADVGPDGTVSNVMCDGGPDRNHQAVPCDQAPKVFFGRMDPKFDGSVTSTFGIFENLHLHAMVDFKTGFMGYDFSNFHRCRGGARCPESAFPQEHDPRRVAMLLRPDLVLGYGLSDMSFVKLREISLSYTLPDSWVRRTTAQRGTFNITARNLRTWTDYSGFDPETIFHQYEADPLHGRFEWRGTPPPMQIITSFRFTL